MSKTHKIKFSIRNKLAFIIQEGLDVEINPTTTEATAYFDNAHDLKVFEEKLAFLA